MRQSITYRGKQIFFNISHNIRKGICECCGDKESRTNLHHWKYKYKVKEVRKNPLLALENTTELCFPKCHDVANALNLIKKTDKKIIEKLEELKKQVLKKENDKNNG
jgi:predicted metal-dependent hydrolase